MTIESVPISEFPLFSKIDRELNQNSTPLTEFQKWAPTLDNFKHIIEHRKLPVNRKVLQEVLKDQYCNLTSKPGIDAQIEAIARPNTFTVTTAHQPSLFTGPVFVISKAISAIKLSRQLNAALKDYHIIPFFVIGSEDHDVEELNHTYLFGNKITWETQQNGPLGRFDLEGIQSCLDQAEAFLQHTKFGPALIDLLKQAHRPDKSFAQAFQYMLNDLLGEFGLLVLNTDDKRLKELFKPIIIDEIIHSTSKPIIQDTQRKLNNLGFGESTHVRDINLFYFGKGFRHRIEKENAQYLVLNQDKTFDESGIREEVEQFPEKFSPNVILRPVYQEVILPNLAYVGGGGELAYWLERKSQFETLGIPYPMLVRRDSFMIITPEQQSIKNQFELSVSELAMRTDMLINHSTEKLSASELNVAEETRHLMDWMDAIKLKGIDIDPTLGPSIEGEKIKLQKAIEHIEKKMLKAEKTKLEVKLNKIKKLKEKVLPETGLPERRENFMTYYAEHGKAFLLTLLEDFNPLDRQVKLIQVNPDPE